MKVTLSTDAPIDVRADLLAIGVSGNPSRDANVKAIDKASNKALRNAIRLDDFSGKAGQTLKCTPGGIKAKSVLLVGLGDGEPDVAAVRQLAATAGRLL